MTDTLESSWLRRLRHTPWRDALRGRVTGRLDWRTAVAVSGLPADAQSVITDVVRRTGLWRSEKADVTRELIAHFADGQAAGVPVDTIVADFGDARAAATLIRRAKQRQRSWVWTARRWFYRGVGALAVGYVVVTVRYYTGAPTPMVDYVADMNKRVLAVPESDRAWPLYVAAHKLLDVERQDTQRATFQNALAAAPGGAGDAVVAAWVAAHREGIETLHRAAAKPVLGFVYGPGGSAGDLMASERGKPVSTVPLVQILLPHLRDLRYFAQCLHADARVAAARGDGRRVVADVRAMLALTDQTARAAPFLVVGLESIGTRMQTLEYVAQTLAARPDVFNDAALIDLAHLLAGPQVPGDLIDVDAERDAFRDILQRSYTDDGHGDGRITAAGFAFFKGMQPMIYGDRMAVNLMSNEWPGRTLLPGLMFVQASRKTVAAVTDRYFDVMAANLRVPLRNADRAAERVVEDEVQRLAASSVLVQMMPSVNRIGTSAERCLGRRDGVTVGLALELFRRRHGAYPSTLNELTPGLLPTVPLDRFDGGPLRYKLVDGKPVVYSVGFDLVDDDGRVPTRADEPLDYVTAEWPPTTRPGDVTPQMAGDWVVYTAGPLRPMAKR